MVWDPARITTKSWANVVELYRHLSDRNEDFRPMRELVEHVASTAYEPPVFAATSGTALLVARDAYANWNDDALRIDVDLGGSIRFVLPRKGHGPPASFECDGRRIIQTFESHLPR